MPRERLRLAAAVGVQLVILALVPLRPVLAAWRGQEVTLATAPVDPFDPFHGAYVRLAYEVERTPPDRAGPDPEEGSVVFLVVEQAEPAWRLVRYADAPPPPAPGRAALRALWRGGQPRLENAGRLYLPAERAREADQAVSAWRRGAQQGADGDRTAPAARPPPLVDLRVDADGNARLLRLRVGDRVFEN